MKTALLIASATIGLVLGNLRPVQAASFEFALDGSNNEFGVFSQGELSFDDSPLTGKGFETVGLSELENATFFFSFLTPPPEFYDGVPSVNVSPRRNPNLEASFTFLNGELNGVFLDILGTEYNVSFSPPRLSIELDYTFDTFFRGDTYRQFFSGIKIVDSTDRLGNNFVDIYRRDNELYFEREILFTTIEPVIPSLEPPTTAVPEPSIIFGIGLIFSSVFSRYKKRTPNVN